MGLITLKMPQLGESVTEGTVDRWLKTEGEMVRRDEPIVEVVTDKVNAEIPSPFEGRLVRIQVAAGQTVAVGTALAELEVEGAVQTPAEPARPAGVVSREPPSAPSPAVRPAISTHGQKVSPVVRRLVEKNGLELSQITATGAGGRVTRGDVISHLSVRQATAAAETTAGPDPAHAAVSGAREELVRVSAVRRQIAEHMVRSVSTSPHAWPCERWTSLAWSSTARRIRRSSRRAMASPSPTYRSSSRSFATR